MKKILFIVPSLEGGGVEKVLINMLKMFSDDMYRITVLGILNKGTRLGEIPNNVRVQFVWKRELLIGGKRIRGTDRLFHVLFECLSPGMLHKIFVREKYDIEVAYWGQEGLKLVLGAGEKTRKYAFIHSDMNAPSMQKAIFPFKSNEQLKEAYLKMDYIVNVSKDCQKSMAERFVFNKAEQKKNIVKYNINLVEEISAYAKEEVEIMQVEQNFVMCTSGRLCKVKGFERLIRICGKLKEEISNFELWILGEGDERGVLEDAIKRYDVEQYVKLLGYKINPYQYMAKADLFVCSSFYEGFSTVVSEAVILGLPIVTTDCTGAREILGDSEYGLVTDIDDESLYLGIKKMISDKEVYNTYKAKVIERQAFFDVNRRFSELEELF